MWDPHGRHLSAAGSAAAPAGAGKQYALMGEGAELVQRFRDQFAPWDFAGGAQRRRAARTLLRLPLRTPDQAEASDICKVTQDLHGTTSCMSSLSIAAVCACHACMRVQEQQVADSGECMN